ncbi:hypothetical protein Tco_1443563 [Tanacetum coccineum]
MGIPDSMISDAIKKSTGYGYYMAKKKESAKDKIVDELEEQHVYPIKSRRGKGYMCYGDKVANFPNKLKKYDVPRKTRSLTIVAETVVDKTEESANETDESDIDLSNDNPNIDDDAIGYGVLMHNKSTATPNSTYLSLKVTSSSLDFIQTLLDETPANELTNFISHPVYTDTQTTLVIKLLHRIQESKSNTTYPTYQKLYDTLYESVCLDHDTLNDPDAEPSFHKRVHDNQDPLDNHNTPDIQPIDQEDEYIWTRSNPEWYTKSSSTKVVRKKTWFDLFLKSDIDQNENHILRPSTVAIAKKLKAITQKDELTIADLEGAGLERLKQ